MDDAPTSSIRFFRDVPISMWTISNGKRIVVPYWVNIHYYPEMTTEQLRQQILGEIPYPYRLAQCELMLDNRLIKL